MRAFAQLFEALDRSPDASEKLAAVRAYFRAAPPADAAWALWLLCGHRAKRAVRTDHLRQWAAEAATLPLWLVEECYAHVGDLCETLALLLPANARAAPLPLAQLVEQRLLPLTGAHATAQHALLRSAWSELDTAQRILWHKLLTANFRPGVSGALLVRALAELAGVEPAVMAHRLDRPWRPTPADFARLMSSETLAADAARPYPFCLPSPLEDPVEGLGAVTDWQVEWAWHGARAQLLRRGGEVGLWSRSDEIITAGFPEIVETAEALADGTVLDGTLLAWRGDAPLPSDQLPSRLNRRSGGAALRPAVPVVFMAYDVLACGGEDVRTWPLTQRRHALEDILARALERCARLAVSRPPGLVQADLFVTEAPPKRVSFALRASPVLPAASWHDVTVLHRQARAAGAEGLMLKRRDAPYGAGRPRGAWWTWKVAPFTCDAVLVAAQPGQGRRPPCFTDCTFAVWHGADLVPVAKADCCLTDDETAALDAFVRAHTTGRFGPVRAVTPQLVFELAFEGLAPSTRHQAGLSLRRPRIVRWRHDQQPADADTLDAVRKRVAAAGAA